MRTYMREAVRIMGRKRTHIDGVEVKRIEMRDCLQRGQIIDKIGEGTKGSFTWSVNGKVTASMSFRAAVQNGSGSIQLLYGSIDRNGERKLNDYYISIESVPSNLGNGNVLYFLCPETLKRCRVLYMAYGSVKFLSREAYLSNGKRIYYTTQSCSKRDKALTGLHQAERNLRLYKEHPRRINRTYRGKVTARQNRLNELQQARDTAEVKQISAFHDFLDQYALKARKNGKR